MNARSSVSSLQSLSVHLDSRSLLGLTTWVAAFVNSSKRGSYAWYCSWSPGTTGSDLYIMISDKEECSQHWTCSYSLCKQLNSAPYLRGVHQSFPLREETVPAVLTGQCAHVCLVSFPDQWPLSLVWERDYVYACVQYYKMASYATDSTPEEIGHGWTSLIKMAEVTLIDSWYLNCLALATFTEVGPNF